MNKVISIFVFLLIANCSVKDELAIDKTLEVINTQLFEVSGDSHDWNYLGQSEDGSPTKLILRYASDDTIIVEQIRGIYFVNRNSHNDVIPELFLRGRRPLNVKVIESYLTCFIYKNNRLILFGKNLNSGFFEEIMSFEEQNSNWSKSSKEGTYYSVESKDLFISSRNYESFELAHILDGNLIDEYNVQNGNLMILLKKSDGESARVKSSVLLYEIVPWGENRFIEFTDGRMNEISQAPKLSADKYKYLYNDNNAIYFLADANKIVKYSLHDFKRIDYSIPKGVIPQDYSGITSSGTCIALPCISFYVESGIFYILSASQGELSLFTLTEK